MSELVQKLNEMQNKLEKFKKNFDFFEDSQQLLEDFEESVTLARLIFMTANQKVDLNENQQVVLNWLKTPPLFPISAVYLLEAGKNVPENVKKAYENFDKKEEAEVLQAFSRWAIEQEEAE